MDRNIDLMEYLIEDGADVNEQDIFGQTALHQAVFGGQIKIVDLLIERANLDLKDEDGDTALDLAILFSKRYCLIVEMLKWADPNFKEMSK
jgi:ankyrin repeat protein